MNFVHLLKFLVILYSFNSIDAFDSESFEVLLDNNILKDGALKALAEYVQTNQNANKITRCQSDVLTWLISYKQDWALRMHDANAKLPSGILMGHVHSLGQFDECLAVDNNSTSQRIRGKYCFVKIPTPEASTNSLKFPISAFSNVPDVNARATLLDENGRLLFNWAACVPSSCEAKELQDMLRQIAKLTFNATVGFIVRENDCVIEEPVKLTGEAIAAITILSFFALLMLVSTLYDLYTKKWEDKPQYHDFFIAFSMYTNAQKLTKINKGASSLRCLHGIRTISIFWVMLNHRYSTGILYPAVNTFVALDWMVRYDAMVIVGGAVSVDTFFVLSGFLLAYVFFKQHRNVEQFSLFKFYFHRFMRLWPAMAMIVLVQVAILPYLGSGPYWNNNLNIFTETCKKWWWTDLLYVQNYVNTMEPCIGQLWYLCVDMHLYILSPIMLYPLLWKPKFGVINMIFWIVVSQIIVIVIVYMHGDWGAILIGGTTEWTIEFYSYSHMRAIPWMMGFGAGYFYYRTSKKQIILPKAVVVIGWILSFCILWIVVFGTRSLQVTDHVVNRLQDGTYNSFARTGWTFAILWIILACIWGYGGPVNWFLSLRLWELTGRITYSMYLLHFGIQFWELSIHRSSKEFSHFLILYDYMGDLVISVIFAFFWALAFESPFLVLEKALFAKKKHVQTNEIQIEEKEA